MRDKIIGRGYWATTYKTKDGVAMEKRERKGGKKGGVRGNEGAGVETKVEYKWGIRK